MKKILVTILFMSIGAIVAEANECEKTEVRCYCEFTVEGHLSYLTIRGSYINKLTGSLESATIEKVGVRPYSSVFISKKIADEDKKEADKLCIKHIGALVARGQICSQQ